MQFNVSDIIMDGEKYNNISLGDFNDSFNMFLGTANTEIDLFDNPYIEFNVYEINSKQPFKLSDKIMLKQC